MTVGRESVPRSFTGRLGVEKVRTSRSVPCVYVSISAGFSVKTGEGEGGFEGYRRRILPLDRLA